MLCQHESNEIDIFELPEDQEYVEGTDTGDEPHRDTQPTYIGSQPMQIGSQPTQISKRTKPHMHEALDEEAVNADIRPLRRQDQTAWRSAATAQNIAHNRRLRRDDQTARCSAGAIMKSSHVSRAAPAPAPPIRSRVTRSQGIVSAEALTASATYPFTNTEAMESPQQDHWKRAMEEESTSILLNNTFSALNSRKEQQLQFKLIGSMWV
jgi:hypothetical protein